jgi:SAM-dependent methyltransferase
MDGTFEARYFSGATLYGDDFDEANIRRWYEEEEHAYYDLVQTYDNYKYDYNAANQFYTYRFLNRRYECCVAIGCATGDDVAPLGDRVDHFVAIEPAEKWWKPEIGGRPARFIKPSLFGDIPLRDESADLIVCLGVLHHIPNVSHVFSEMARILSPSGSMVIREPISTMGDWRIARPGVTRNERGFPPGWLEQKAETLGLQIERASYCGFPLMGRVAKILGLTPAYNSPSMVRFDAALSQLMKWNLHYHRDSFLKKMAPGARSFIFKKVESSGARV